jgi:Rhodopirellula transposase DDE domain
LQMWWQHVRAFYGHIKRLVIYLDNGPKNSGRRTQFLKRMVQFADWSGLELYAFRQFHAPLEIYGELQTVLIVSMSSRTAHRLLTASSCNAS